MVFGPKNGSYSTSNSLSNLLLTGNFAQRIVPSSAMKVAGVGVVFKDAPGAGSLTVGIASGVAASPPWIGKGTITTTAGTAAGSSPTCDLDVVCNLNAGTTYYFTVVTDQTRGNALALCSPANLTITGFTNGANNKGGYLYYQTGFGSFEDNYRLTFNVYDIVPAGGGSVASKSIMEAILYTKRATVANSSNMAIDDVNYYDRDSAGPGALHRTINDLWYARWGNLGEKTSINDRMYKFFSGNTPGSAGQHMSVADNIAAWFHAGGNP